MALHIKQHQIEDFERVVEFTDVDFKCFIAVHNTRLGPALGGCRLKPYESDEDALADVLRLAKGMTYKSSLAGLHIGGGKCVVRAERANREIMLKVGEAVNFFNGEFITGEDIGTTLDDIYVLREVSPNSVRLDGSQDTARGVLSCMRAAAQFKWGSSDLNGIPIWVQGVGKVGIDLVARLSHLDDPNIAVTDLNGYRLGVAVETFGARRFNENTDPDTIAIYAPCALGQVVHADNVDTLRYPIICGSANNQLASSEFAQHLHQRGILYCPDYLVNAGGVISAAGEIEGWTPEQVGEQCENLGNRLTQVLQMAEEIELTPLVAANWLAEARL